MAVSLVLAGCPGLRFPALAPSSLGSSQVSGGITAARPVPMGQVSLAIRWPERQADRQVQAIPVAANFITLSVVEANLTAQTTVATASFTRPAAGFSLVATASIPLRLGQVVKVLVNAYKDVQTVSEPDPSLVIAQGVQENVSVALDKPTKLTIDIDPEVIVAGIGGTPALGLDTIRREDVPPPQVPALWTQLNAPDHLAFDPRGRYLYFTQAPDPGRVREGDYLMRLCMRPDSPGTAVGVRNYGNMAFIAGGSIAEGASPDALSALETSFLEPTGLVAFESPALSGKLAVYVSDKEGHVVRRIDADDQVSTAAGIYKSASTVDLDGPRGLALQAGLTPDQTFIYVADTGNDRVQRIRHSDGTVEKVFSLPTGTESVAVMSSYEPIASVSCPVPQALAIGTNPLNETLVYVGGEDRVIEVNSSRQRSRTILGGAGSDEGLRRTSPFSSVIQGVGGLLASRAGNNCTVFVSDRGNGCVWRIVQPFTAEVPGATAEPQVVIQGLQGPAGLSFSADGTSLLVAEASGHRIRRFRLSDLPAVGSGGRGLLASVGSAETIGVGIAEPFDSVSATFDNGGFVSPVAAVEPVAGTRLVLDSGTGRIRRVTGSGIRTVAGMGSGKRFERGSGLKGAGFHLGKVQAIDMDRTGVSGSNLGDATSLRRLVVFSAADDDSQSAAIEIAGLDGLPVTANGTDRLLASPATCSVLFENMITRDIKPDNARPLDIVTGITVNPVPAQTPPPFPGTPTRQADLLERYLTRTGPVAVSVAGVFSALHSWDSRFREWSYGVSLFRLQGFRPLAGTGPSGTNANGPGALIQVEKPRLARYDIDGNLYFVTASKDGTLLRRILRNEPLNEQPLVQTVAGGGKASIPAIGVGRPVLATNVGLGDVVSLDVDTAGQVYLASGGSIFRVNRDGSILEMYKSKKRTFKSIAFDETEQAIYFTTEGEPYIRKVFFPRSS